MSSVSEPRRTIVYVFNGPSVSLNRPPLVVAIARGPLRRAAFLPPLDPWFVRLGFRVRGPVARPAASLAASAPHLASTAPARPSTASAPRLSTASAPRLIAPAPRLTSTAPALAPTSMAPPATRPSMAPARPLASARRRLQCRQHSHHSISLD